MPAQHVALPESSDEESRGGFLNTWQPPRHSASNGNRSPYTRTRTAAMRDEIIHNVQHVGRKVLKMFNKLSLLQKILVVFALLALNVAGILFLVFNEKIFGWLEPLAERWKNTTGGWVILWAITIVVGFPPIIGYSTCCTTAGFVYGLWEGWLILATATIVGSFCSFLLSRTILRKYVERMIANDTRFTALTLTLKQDGLKLLVMIRLCPLPYSLSNGALSTFPTIHPATFALATALATPRLLIPAFIGSRLAAIARNKEQMPLGTKLINWFGIGGGIALGTFVAWYIYQKTMARARELEEEQAASEGPRGPAPRRFSDDPEAQVVLDAETSDSDVVDFFDETPGSYRDDPSELHGEDDIFARIDSDVEGEPIGLKSTGGKK